MGLHWALRRILFVTQGDVVPIHYSLPDALQLRRGAAAATAGQHGSGGGASHGRKRKASRQDACVGHNVPHVIPKSTLCSHAAVL